MDLKKVDKSFEIYWKSAPLEKTLDPPLPIDKTARIRAEPWMFLLHFEVYGVHNRFKNQKIFQKKTLFFLKINFLTTDQY